MKKIGLITIGQAPRMDVAPIVEKYLYGQAELIQVGVLDGMLKEEIEKDLFPEPDDYVLTSRLVSGDSVVMSRKKVQPILQKKIEWLEKEGIKEILLLCTGVFPGLKITTAHLIEPDHILPPTIRAMLDGRTLGVMIPLSTQKGNIQEKYSPYKLNPVYAVASPYSSDEEVFKEAARRLKEKNADLILMDCMGYTEELKVIVQEESGLPVVLSNALIAKLISEMV